MSDQDLSRLSRLTSIITQLQSKKIVTATSLAEKYNVSVRTIYRDIRSLEASGIPIYTEEGKGYSLLEGYNLPPVMFSEEEANALITAYKIISKNKDSSLVKAYGEAINKIKSVLKGTTKEKVNLLSERIAYIKNFSNHRSSDLLSSIQLSITRAVPIEIKYHSLYKNEESLRTIEAQALYHTHDNWILIAWCRKRKAMREFRLDRIKTIKVLSEKLNARPFDLMEYFQSQLKENKLSK